MEPHERAAAGLFLGFQYPVEIPGVSYLQFLRESLNSQRRARGEAELSAGEFIRLAREQAALLGMDTEMLKRPVNVGFSGGEKKRAEMVQMGIIEPAFAVLDETDSGLDIDALQGRRRRHQPHHARARQGRAADHPLPAAARLCRSPTACTCCQAGRIERSGRPRARPRARARGLCGGGCVTALLPHATSRRMALRRPRRAEPVWEQLLPEPVTLHRRRWRRALEDDLASRRRRRRAAAPRPAGARAKAPRRAFSRSTPRPVYGRIELEVSLAEGAEFALFAANIGTGLSTNEIVTNVKHLGAGGRSRQTIRSVLNGKAVGSYLGKVEVARGAQQTDAEQSVKAMLLDRGATANCKPELEIFADDVKCAHGATRRRIGRDATLLRREPRPRPGERPGAAARRLRHGPVGRLPRRAKRARSAKPRAMRCGGCV